MGELIGLCAVVLPFSIPIVAIWTRHQRRMAEMHGVSGAADTERYEALVRRLEDRVQVLERIVTDRGYDVAAQIEALRDERVALPTPRQTTPVA